MDNFEILNKWAEFSNYDETKTSFSLGQWYLHSGNKDIVLTLSEYDATGTISVLYAKQLFNRFLEDSKTSWYDVFNAEELYKDIKEMWDVFYGKYVVDLESRYLSYFESIVRKVIPVKQIGDVEFSQYTSILLDSISIVIKALSKCNNDCFLEGTKPIKIENFSTHIQVFSDIAECLLVIENSDDGMYLCYIDNNQSPAGFFGFFIKSEDTIFSINERLVEPYAGSFKNHRNARYSEDKKYELFPYNYIFKYLEHDYKGVATKHIIDKDNLDFFKLGPAAYMPLLLSMVLIKYKYENKEIDLPKVYADVLMPMNYLLENTSPEALMVVKNSQVMKANQIEVEFTTEGILNNEYGSQFDYSSNRDNKDLKYFETGQFQGLNQIFVDTYGQGFVYKPEQIFERNKHLKSLPRRIEEAEVNSFGEKPEFDDTPNNPLIGTENYMRLQAYYEARKQLADYIIENMKAEHKSFGLDRVVAWYPEMLRLNRDYIEQIILEAELSGEFDNKDYKIEKFIDVKDEYWYIPFDRILNKRERQYHKCSVTGTICNVWYQIIPMNWKGLQYLLGNGSLPKIFTGWYNPSYSHHNRGNSILDAVDPVSQIQTPFESTGSFSYTKYYYKFDFAIGYSKRGLSRKIKEYKLLKGES